MQWGKWLGWVGIAMLWAGLLQAASPYEETGNSGKPQAELKWHTLQTEHFEVHYHEGLEDLARLSASYAEESHALLSPLLDWQTREKVQIIVSDTQDQQDGNATNLPYPMLRLFPNAPEISSVIGEYESSDWLRALILHEYVHVLHLDTVEGYSQWVRSVFGRPGAAPNPIVNTTFMFLNSPNNFVPLWFLEGLAVYFETELTHSGRGRSSRSEMILRMAVKENQFVRLDQLDFYKPGIPGQHARYLYGAYLVNFWVHASPESAIRNLNHSIPQWLPYTGILTAQGPQGESLREVYESFRQYQHQEQQKHLDLLAQQPLTDLKPLAPSGYWQSTPALSPDETLLAFSEANADEGKLLRIWHRDTGTLETFGSGSAVAMDWHPSQRWLFYTMANKQGIYTYQDLYAYDLEKKRAWPLTQGARLGDFDLAPDGKKLVAVENGQGHQNLVTYDLEVLSSVHSQELPLKLTRQKTLTRYQYSRVATPRWDHRGQRLAYSLTDRQGVTTLPILEVENNQELQKITVGHLQFFPAWEPGDEALLFSSDHSGVENIYRYELKTGSMHPVTHVLGSASMPVIAEKSGRLYLQNYTKSGFQLAFLPWQPGQAREKTLPQITTTWKFNRALAAKRDASKPLPVLGSPEVYSAWKQLKPQFWFIYGEEEPEGYAWGAITAGEDPLLKHSYYGVLAKGKEHTYHRFGYINDQWTPTFSLNSAQLPRRYPFGLNIPKLWELIHEASFTASWTVRGSWSLGASWLYEYHEPFKDQNFVDTMNDRFNAQIASNLQKPQASLPALFKTTRDYYQKRTLVGRQAGAEVFLTYKNLGQYPLSISEAFGRIASFTLEQYPSSWGDDPELRVVQAKHFDRELLKLSPTGKLTAAQETAFIETLRKQEQVLKNDTLRILGSYTEYWPFFGKHHVLKLATNLGYSAHDNELQAPFLTGYDVPLRGYQNQTETVQRFVTQSIEWRLPLAQIFRGMGLLPIYYRQWHTSFFYDYAAFDGNYQSEDVIVGQEIFYLREEAKGQTRRSAGVEFKLLTQLGYRFPLNLIVRLSQAIDMKNIPGAEKEKAFWAQLDYETAF